MPDGGTRSAGHKCLINGWSNCDLNSAHSSHVPMCQVFALTPVSGLPSLRVLIREPPQSRPASCSEDNRCCDTSVTPGARHPM